MRPIIKVKALILIVGILSSMGADATTTSSAGTKPAATDPRSSFQVGVDTQESLTSRYYGKYFEGNC
jgi:hypothetical protein